MKHFHVVNLLKQIANVPDSASGISILEYNSLEECESKVRELYNTVPANPFFTYEWLYLWKKYFAPKAKVKVLVIQDNGKTIGFLPLVYRNIPLLFTTVFQFMGTYKSNYLCIPAAECSKRKVYDEVFRYFKAYRRGAILQIEGVNDSTTDYSILVEKQDAHKLVKGYRFFQFSCPYINLEGSWDELFKKHYSKSKRRSRLNGFEEKLEYTGKVQFIRICDEKSYAAYGDLLEQTFAIHRLRFRNEWNSSRYSEDAYSGFYRELFREYARMGLLDMSLICIDGIVVSFSLAFRQGKTLIGYIPGFYIPFKCFSLGHVHLMKLFRHLLNENDISCFDLSLGNQEYKERWADGHTYNYSFLFRFGNNPFTLASAFFMKQLMEFRAAARKRGWNEKVKWLLARIRKIKTEKSFLDEEGFLVDCSEKPISWTSEKEYTLKELLLMPLCIQTFVLKQIYGGKKISFLYQGSNLAGIKAVDDQEEIIYQYIQGKIRREKMNDRRTRHFRIKHEYKERPA
ncbi:MAG TPA: GNAT family N-acetyltransferase [Clostridiales bacterium]|nr:GNAT family N-acetyltransferase [Clostridiales bacterium]